MGRKHYREKENSLRAISPFPSVFKRFVLQTRKNQGLFGKGLKEIQSFNPIPNKPWFFTCLQDKSLENAVGKGEIALCEQFLIFPQCFLPFWRTFCLFYQI